MRDVNSECILAYITDHPGCLINDVARAIFRPSEATGRDAQSDRRSAYNKAAFEVRVLEATHHVRSELDRETACKRLYATNPTVDDVENTNPRLFSVRMSKRQLHLLCHILRRGLEDNYLGEPTRSVLQHLDAEMLRIERAHSGTTAQPRDNVCEHGDHPAPPGRRFCSVECQRCEGESENGCDNICGLGEDKRDEGTAMAEAAYAEMCIAREAEGE